MEMANSYKESGQKDKALNFLSKAFDMAEKMTEKNFKAVVFTEIAIAYAKIEQP